MNETTGQSEDQLVRAKQDGTVPLIAFLRERDVPCPRCGYNLRSLTNAHCPECEHPLELILEGRKARVDLLVLAVLPSFVVGVVGVVGVVTAALAVRFEAMSMFLAPAIIDAMLTIFLLGGGHEFIKQPRLKQLGYVVSLWFLQTFIFAIFVAVIAASF